MSTRGASLEGTPECVLRGMRGMTGWFPQGAARSRRKSLLLAVACFLVASFSAAPVAHAAEQRPPSEFFALNMGDFKAEAAEAKADGKSALLIMFEQEGCPGCIYMRRNVLNQGQVQDYFRNRFQTLSVDIWGSLTLKDFSSQDTNEKAFARAANIKGTPTFIFYDLGGSEIYRFLGTIEDPHEFVRLGEFVGSGAYKTRTFAQYKRESFATKGK